MKRLEVKKQIKKDDLKIQKSLIKCFSKNEKYFGVSIFTPEEVNKIENDKISLEIF